MEDIVSICSLCHQTAAHSFVSLKPVGGLYQIWKCQSCGVHRDISSREVAVYRANHPIFTEKTVKPDDPIFVEGLKAVRDEIFGVPRMLPVIKTLKLLEPITFTKVYDPGLESCLNVIKKICDDIGVPYRVFVGPPDEELESTRFEKQYQEYMDSLRRHYVLRGYTFPFEEDPQPIIVEGSTDAR